MALPRELMVALRKVTHNMARSSKMPAVSMLMVNSMLACPLSIGAEYGERLGVCVSDGEHEKQSSGFAHG